MASIPYPPVNVDYLEREFSGHGVTFAELGDSCVVRMGLESGSMATLMLPSGLVTSYKVPMWHGGTLEMLHTTVSEGENGGGKIQGGVSLAVKCGSEDGFSWSPNTWALTGVTGDPQDSIEVELISSDSEGMVEVKYKVNLQQDVLTSELAITNSKTSSIRVTGSVVTHLTISTPDATYVIGLEGSNFFNRPPFLSNYSIIPPNWSQDKGSGYNQLWSQTSLSKFLSNWVVSEANEEDSTIGKEVEGEESDNYKHLTEEMSNIYTNAPRNFTIIDRGRRNSIVVGRNGFEELYMFSPGSTHEWYGKYAYVCLGPSAMLTPIVIRPEDTWSGGQHLHNPSL